MANQYAIVGRVRKPHGIRGDLVVQPICDDPAEVFAAGQLVYVGDDTGVPDVATDPIEVVHGRPFKDTWLVGLRGVRDRNDAELWRGKHLLALATGLRPLATGETYLHELTGMHVVDVRGESVGEVASVDQLPQGLLLNVRTARGESSIPFVDAIVVGVDRDARVITVDLPAGLLDL